MNLPHVVQGAPSEDFLLTSGDPGVPLTEFDVVIVDRLRHIRLDDRDIDT